jgi:hypothetical protein
MQIGNRHRERMYTNDTAAADFFTSLEEFTAKKSTVFKMTD